MNASVDHSANIQAVASHNHAAFAALFAHFAPRVKAWMIRSGIDPATADELAQETLAAVWYKASSFDPDKTTPAGWIFTMARDLRAVSLRNDQRVTAFYTDAEIPEPIDLVTIAERAALLKSAIQDLPTEQAVVLRKAFLEETSHRAIERELNIPLGTVKARIRLAIRRLRARLDDLR